MKVPVTNFPSRAPVGLMTGVLLSFLSIVPVMAAWQMSLPFAQRFYLAQYAVSYFSGTPVGKVAAFFKGSKTHTFHVLAQNGHLLSNPIDPEAAPISVQALALEDPIGFHAWLRAHIYGGREADGLLKRPVGGWCLLVIALLLMGALLDFRRRKHFREGMQLRGGELLTVNEFNRATKGDGFALYVRR